MAIHPIAVPSILAKPIAKEWPSDLFLNISNINKADIIKFVIKALYIPHLSPL